MFIVEILLFGIKLFSKDLLDLMEKLVDEVSALSDAIPLVFNFGEVMSEFNAESSKFKLKPDTLVYQVVALICKKYNVANPRGYSLKTLGGYILEDEKPLAYYGFGGLVLIWELNVIRKIEEKSKSEKSPEYVVTFLFASMYEFKGSNSTTKLINPNIPTGQLVDLICRRIEQKPEKYRLAGDANGNYQFSKKLGLGSYGLGTRFKKMNVYVVLENNNNTFVMRPEYSWTQIDPELTLENAKNIIKGMDNQFTELSNNRDELKLTNKQMKIYLRNILKEKKIDRRK